MEYLEGKTLINQKKKILNAYDVLQKTDIIVFYFTASWCQQCIEANEKLKEIYEEAKARNIELEIINVPNERNMSEFLDFFKLQGNWYSLIFGDILAQELVWIFGITYLPNVIVITKDGQVVTKNGYNELMKIGKNVLVTWT